MKQESYLKVKTESFDKDHKHFGGIIYQSDFNTCRSAKAIADGSVISRILSDFRWENQILKDGQKRKSKVEGSRYI